MIIQVKGQAISAALRPCCAAVSANVAPVAIIWAAALTPSAIAMTPLIAATIAEIAMYAVSAATMPYTIGAMIDQLSPMKVPIDTAKSNTFRRIFARVAIASIAPWRKVWNASLLAKSFSLWRTGWNAISAVFCIDCHICPQVIGISLNMLLMSSAAEKIAALTTSAESSPSAAISLILPIGTSR